MKNLFKRRPMTVARVKREAPPEVIEGLKALYAKYPLSVEFIGDMLLYADIGRDRAGLTMEWVEKTEVRCRESEEMMSNFLARGR